MAHESNPNPYRRPNSDWWQKKLDEVLSDQELERQASGDTVYLRFLQDERIHGIRYLMDSDSDEAKEAFLDAYSTRAAYEAEKFSDSPESETRP